MENKPWYLSKTVWGAVFAVIGLIAPKVAAGLGSEDVLLDIVSNVVALAGSVLAVYGRVTATTTIGPKTGA